MSTEVHGRLTRDPELTFGTAKGTAIAKIGIAENERTRGEDGQWKDGEPSFFEAVAFGPMAEGIAEELAKGMPVVATGRMKQRSYVTKEGEKRTVWEFHLTDIGRSLKWPGRPQGGTAEPPF